MPEGDEAYRKALELALGKLRAQDRFEAEIRQILSEFSAADVERVIQFLKERRIIDDTKTTLNLVARYSGKRAVGLEKLRAELLERGAPEETIDTVLEANSNDERQRMFEALQAKFSPEGSARAKAGRFLFSRGFPEEEIEGALDRFFQA